MGVPGNKGNTRIGIVKGGKGMHQHQKAWHDDPIILERLAESTRLRAQGWTVERIAAHQGVSPHTVVVDWKRSIELHKAEAVDAVDAHIANLNSDLERLFAQIEAEEDPRARAQLWGEVRQTRALIARLDGSEIQRHEVKSDSTLLEAIQRFTQSSDPKSPSH